MRDPEEEPGEPLLFDLPLEPERGRVKRATRSAPREERPPAPGPELIFDEPEELPAAAVKEVSAGGAVRAGIGKRLAAGAADLVVHAAVAVGVLVGCRYMGVKPVVSDWPALTLFLLTFSCLYSVVTLAFWGHTPGMAWAGLAARSRDGQPMAFDQTARRWIGGLLTALLVGLPLLLAFGGRSLSDLLSGSETLSSR